MDVSNFVLSFLNKLSGRRARQLFDLTGVEICKDTGYKSGHEPPRDGWQNYDAQSPLTGDDTHFWFRAKFTTPPKEDGRYLELRASTGKEGEWDLTNPQGLLYLNGKMSHALDYGHREAPLEPSTEYTLYNYFNMGMYKGGRLYLKMAVWSVDLDVERLYYDMKIPYDACMLLPAADGERARMMSVLTEAVRRVDMREGIGKEFSESVMEAIRFMESEFYGKLCTPSGKPVVHCIGSTHIDVEWLWARDQTREKIQRSFSNVKSLMDRYPDFSFTLSQPELYRYLKEEAPEKYEELKSLVKEGRWEPEGAMYVEPDCNLTSGESLVRQIMYGKRFFKEEFGKDSKVLYLPDVFGYSAALPQILKKSGVDYFVTSKISWNDTNTMPNEMFYWEGIDGTEIFTSFMTAQPYGGYAKSARKNEATYNSNITASYVKGTWDRFSNKEFSNDVFMTFGYGDGGGGPTKEMLETEKRLRRGIPSLPVTRMNKLLPYLESVKGEFDESVKRCGYRPSWTGELYLEFHRGTYSSIAKVKRQNRYAENLLGAVESISALDKYMGGEVDREGLSESWRRVLHNQFHDILPGSSIKKVYDFTDKDYSEIEKWGNDTIREKLQSIKERVNTEGGILFYNPTCILRRAVSRCGEFIEYDDFVPPFGYTVVKKDLQKSRVRVKGLEAENDCFTLTLNESGEIARLYDKRVRRDIISDTANTIVAYEDYPLEYDAWELSEYYKLKSYRLDKAEITPIADGTRGGFVIVKRYMSSVITQTLWLYSYSDRIDFETHIDWHERHQVLKAHFPIAAHATSATYDVQFGHLSRPTHQNTSWDSAKFETYAHKWADISDYSFGAAILSDSKYGYSAEGSRLSLTLLKCATDPNPEADQGIHEFTYSIYPHIGGFREGGVIEAGIELNAPLYECEVRGQSGTLPETFSLASLSRSGAVITAVKPAEDDPSALIVRLYEAYDSKDEITLTVPGGYKRAYLTNILEENIAPLDIVNGNVRLSLSNFEIVTVKLEK